MQQEKTDSYEFEERAAIREFDGGYPREKAEQLAAADLQERQTQRQEQQRHDGRSRLQQLRDQRDQIGRQMRDTGESSQKNELFAEWQRLCTEIIELKKKGITK